MSSQAVISLEWVVVFMNGCRRQQVTRSDGTPAVNISYISLDGNILRVGKTLLEVNEPINQQLQGYET
jgi:hypothetical protein